MACAETPRRSPAFGVGQPLPAGLGCMHPPSGWHSDGAQGRSEADQWGDVADNPAQQQRSPLLIADVGQTDDRHLHALLETSQEAALGVCAVTRYSKFPLPGSRKLSICYGSSVPLG